MAKELKRLTFVSTAAGFNPLEPAAGGGDKWALVALARAVWEQSGGRYKGVDILPCDASNPAQCDEYADMVAALRTIGYHDVSTFIFTPPPFDLTNPATREAGKKGVLDQVLLADRVGATVAAGPVTEGWTADLHLGDVSDAQFEDEVVQPVSAALAWISNEAGKKCKTVVQLLAEYLCRREYRRSTRPSRIAKVVSAANLLATGPIRWSVLHDTSHLYDWAISNGKSMDDVKSELATTSPLANPRRRHLSALTTRGELNEDTPMPTKELMDAITGCATDVTWGIELFPWWDAGVRTAVRGFGTRTFAKDDMVGALCRAAEFVDRLYPVAAA